MDGQQASIDELNDRSCAHVDLETDRNLTIMQFYLLGKKQKDTQARLFKLTCLQ